MHKLRKVVFFIIITKMKQLITYCVFIILCTSCDFINSGVVKEETIVAQEKQAIDLSTVDEFPSFPDCDHLTGETQKECFFQTLTNQVYERLTQNEFVVSKRIQDTIQVTLEVDSKGIIKLIHINKQVFTAQQLPSLDSLINVAIQNLPKASPANKRGNLVATKFVLPIILNVAE